MTNCINANWLDFVDILSIHFTEPLLLFAELSSNSIMQKWII